MFKEKYAPFSVASLAFFVFAIFPPLPVFAQNLRLPPSPTTPNLTSSQEATKEATASALTTEEEKKIEEIKKEDVTKPEEEEKKIEFFALFEQRPAHQLTATNAFAYAVQFAVAEGVPANTIMLILLLPFLGTLIAFLRHVVGLPSFDIIVPIALAITFVATGIAAGLILLAAIIFASFIGRIILRPIRIMHLPKVALSLLVVSVFVFISLTASAVAGVLQVRQLSIFPVLLLIILSERIMRLQLQRSMRETLTITTMTIILGIIGFLILSSQTLRNFVLLYPETTLILIPINIAIGTYFGIRLSEYFRFRPILESERK